MFVVATTSVLSAFVEEQLFVLLVVFVYLL